MGYRVDGQGSIHSRGKRFFGGKSLHSAQTSPNLLSSGYWGLSPGVSQPEREPNSSHLSSAEVKNGGAKSPVPHTSS
jgi:hypothetical protein